MSKNQSTNQTKNIDQELKQITQNCSKKKWVKSYQGPLHLIQLLPGFANKTGEPNSVSILSVPQGMISSIFFR
jgi:hypothetical protein